jgi:tripartite-type tricarboxylate transporter receptor subunit TctC
MGTMTMTEPATKGLPRRRLLAFAAGALALPALMRFAFAQAYPTRPITIIVPFPPGGGTDIVARILAEHMRASLGQPVIIENIGGAAGSIGVGRAVRAAADGYTLICGTSTTHVLIGALYSLPYDLVTDFDQVAELGSEPLLIAGRKDLPADNLQALIAWLKANPGKASVGTAGVGAIGHVAGLLFQQATGTRYQFVPYRGNGPALQDLLAGHIDFMIEPSSNFLPQLRAGNLKAYAVAAKGRLAEAPDIPTADEAGLAGFTALLWYGLWTPKGVPQAVIGRLNAAVLQGLAASDLRARFIEHGVEVAPRDLQTPEGLRTLQKAEIEKWWPLIKAAGIKAE